MKSILFIITTFLSINFFGQNSLTTQTNSYYVIKSDTLYKVVKIDTSGSCSSKLNAYTQGDFINSDLLIIDSLLNVFIIEHTNPTKPFECGLQIHAYQYYYQFIAMKDSVGQRILWINAFSPTVLVFNGSMLTRREKKMLQKGKLNRPLDNWHKDIICGHDGCGIFWEFKINVKNKSMFDIGISGI